MFYISLCHFLPFFYVSFYFRLIFMASYPLTFYGHQNLIRRQWEESGEKNKIQPLFRKKVTPPPHTFG